MEDLIPIIMKAILKIIVTFFIYAVTLGCGTDDSLPETKYKIVIKDPETNTYNNPPITPQVQNPNYKYLALGDSYTIGQSVCESCRFPEQLRKSLRDLNPNKTYNLDIIAQTGWTTNALISQINSKNPEPNYDLVTLLIGVNNQYQNMPFSTYQAEFPELVTKAIALAKGNKQKVIVISIPDYAYTPYGRGLSQETQLKISTEIDRYNNFAKSYCETNSITYINITDITRQGLDMPSLVSSDDLHPSELAYSLFVERILPKAVTILQK